MKLIMKLLIIFSILTISMPLMAMETFQDLTEARKFADQFMEIVGRGKISEAYDSIKPYVSMNSIQVDSAAEETKQLRRKYAMRYGPPKGFQFISEKKVGDSLYRLLYIEKSERQAVPWVFYFYKSDKEWRLDEFDWTERISVLFTEN